MDYFLGRHPRCLLASKTTGWGNPAASPVGANVATTVLEETALRFNILTPHALRVCPSSFHHIIINTSRACIKIKIIGRISACNCDCNHSIALLLWHSITEHNHVKAVCKMNIFEKNSPTEPSHHALGSNFLCHKCATPFRNLKPQSNSTKI